ncbi:hypothetical protein [Chryseolinea lacunae]|uniref:Uncharacterized protein n=1 Tax=Chryseolinea lacunae TaxID=2801331 RepID=A0ABS1KYX0_9BACT|nr:hypothetical protein [Chryseolinea lacunae]MBL0744530.1 hypothetical protein [Chryseolinea lacunae]
MDTKALDQALQEIVAKRGELEKLDYNNPKYDDLEDQLHDLEDDFQDEYGDYLEEAFQNVHDEFCPDNDVLTAIAYLGAGIPVDIDKLPGKDTRLVLYAGPTRIVLALGKDKQQVVWSAEKA